MFNKIQKYLDVAQDAAEIGGKRLHEAFGKRVQTVFRDGGDPTTHVDLETENIIVNRIRKDFPKHNFLSEEKGEIDNNSSKCWIIDPLDGTSNFIHGLAHFCISIALFDKGLPLLGIVYDPIQRDMYMAINGYGAFMNGNPLRVSKSIYPAQSLLVTGFSTSLIQRRHQLKLLQSIIEKFGAIRETGSAALSLCFVARGIYDGYWESGLKIWDMAAGSLIISEAGGIVTDIDGGLLSLTSDNILASNNLLYPILSALLAKSK